MSPMDLQPAPEKQRYLTPEVFASFLLWLSPDPGRAAQEYLDIRKTLMKFFVRKGCTHAEELTDRTLDRVVLIVHREPGKYPTPISLCCGVGEKSLVGVSAGANARAVGGREYSGTRSAGG